jgi:hypothetical protein
LKRAMADPAGGTRCGRCVSSAGTSNQLAERRAPRPASTLIKRAMDPRDPPSGLSGRRGNSGGIRPSAERAG